MKTLVDIEQFADFIENNGEIKLAAHPRRERQRDDAYANEFSGSPAQSLVPFREGARRLPRIIELAAAGPLPLDSAHQHSHSRAGPDSA